MDAKRNGAPPDEVIRATSSHVALEHHLVSKYTSLVAVDVTPSAPAGTDRRSSTALPGNLPGRTRPVRQRCRRPRRPRRCSLVARCSLRCCSRRSLWARLRPLVVDQASGVRSLTCTRAMTTVAADRGGPVGRAARAARTRMRAAARGTMPASRPAESSPIGGDAAGRSVALALAIVALALAAPRGVRQRPLHLRQGRRRPGAAAVRMGAQRNDRRAGASRGRGPTRIRWRDCACRRSDVDELVLAGASGRTLAWGPGHLDGSAPPGAAGNAVLSAHRDTHFRFLQRVVPGDPLVDRARERRYAATIACATSFVADVRALAHSARHAGADAHARHVLSVRRGGPGWPAALRGRRRGRGWRAADAVTARRHREPG